MFLGFPLANVFTDEQIANLAAQIDGQLRELGTAGTGLTSAHP
jgi:hypothetical protein